MYVTACMDIYYIVSTDMQTGRWKLKIRKLAQ
jgi:hypothetical protein